MGQKNEPLAIQRKHPLGLGRMIFMLGCLAIPVMFFLLTGHPAFIVIFISGLGSISVYIARLINK